mgnify:CR=1 FL=1
MRCACSPRTHASASPVASACQAWPGRGAGGVRAPGVRARRPVKLEGDGRATQLTPTLISRQYSGEPKHHWTGRLVAAALVLLLGLTAAAAARLRKLRREWFGQDAVDEREGLNRDEEDGAGEEDEDEDEDEEAYDVDEIDQRQRGGVPSRAAL